MNRSNVRASAASSDEMARGVGALGAATTGVGAAVLALVAGACCVSPVIAPLIVGVLGAGGSVWAAGLKPYGWWILGGSALCLSVGFWSVYRPRSACALTDRPKSNRFMQGVAKASLGMGAVFWIAGVTLRLVLS
jgi:hypothetical protein